MSSLLPAVDVEPRSTHKRTVIWLHGLGDSGHGFAPIAAELNLPDSLGIRFVFPHAPNRAITINGGMHMPGWYDIKSLDFNQRADSEGVNDSTRAIVELIEAEMAKGIASENIMLAGFSQGGVIAFNVAFTFAKPLAAVMGLSTYVHNPDTLSIDPANASIPVFQAHGVYDDVVAMAAGYRAKLAMEKAGLNVQWHEFPMRHNVCAEEIAAIRQWMLSVFS